MKNYFRLTLYILVSIIIAAGLLLFIFHTFVFSWLEGSSNLTVNIPGPIATSSSASSLDLSLLQSPRFTALKNNVVNFDFDNICWRPNTTVVAQQPIAKTADSGATSTEATSTAPVRCVQGNNVPFAVPAAAKK